MNLTIEHLGNAHLKDVLGFDLRVYLFCFAVVNGKRYIFGLLLENGEVMSS